MRIGDYYVTKGGQGNKQTFYHQLQESRKIKHFGKIENQVAVGNLQNQR